MQGVGDRSAVSDAELDAYLLLIKQPDQGRAFLQIMRSSERTPVKQALYRAVVGGGPYPVQAIWGADDPAMTPAVYGEKARAAAGLAEIGTVPGKHSRRKTRRRPSPVRSRPRRCAWPLPTRCRGAVPASCAQPLPPRRGGAVPASCTWFLPARRRGAGPASSASPAVGVTWPSGPRHAATGGAQIVPFGNSPVPLRATRISCDRDT